MRVIAGKCRGRRLYFPKDLRIRPLTDRIKESLFSVLTAKIPHSKVLDLYAGTGAFGIESLSRAADHVVFVENNRKAIESIMQNLHRTQLEEFAEILNEDVYEFLKRGSKKSHQYNIIFMDPPFEQVMSSEFFSQIKKHVLSLERLLFDDGLLIVRVPRSTQTGEMTSLFILEREKIYGRSKVLFCRKSL